MTELEIIDSIQMIQTQLALPQSRVDALTNAMKASPQRGLDIVNLFNNVNEIRYVGGEDRFLSLLSNLIE